MSATIATASRSDPESHKRSLFEKIPNNQHIMRLLTVKADHLLAIRCLTPAIQQEPGKLSLYSICHLSRVSFLASGTVALPAVFCLSQANDVDTSHVEKQSVTEHLSDSNACTWAHQLAQQSYR